MKHRETSIQAYETIKYTNLLSKKRFAVYETLFKYGPLTATGIADRIPHNKSPSVGFNVHARLCELRDRGVVQELGVIECPFTKMKVINWDVTPNLPKNPEQTKKPRAKEKDVYWNYSNEPIYVLFKKNNYEVKLRINPNEGIDVKVLNLQKKVSE